jgi:Putative Flp pilus-assembly TadE/G-like
MEAYVDRGRRERGAILVQVAISILALTAFMAFVVDYGVLWVARGQAQNAADAGALAGGIALAFDDVNNPPTTTRPFNSAKLTALCASRASGCPTAAPFANPIWPSQTGASSGVEVFFDCPPSFSGRCLRVNVYRNGSTGSVALPMFLGPLLGVTSQGVRATATARVLTGNTTDCLRPWAVADKWLENGTTAGQFDRWSSTGTELTPHDVYRLPWDTSTDGPTGFQYPDDVGYEQTLIAGHTVDSTIPPGWSLSVQLPDGVGGYTSGTSAYGAAIANCVGRPVSIGQYLPTENMGAGGTKNGFDDLEAKDPNATWNSTTKLVENSCAPTCASFSPRVVPIAVFDMDDFQRRKNTNDTSPCPQSGGQCVRIVNIIGFFADRRGTGQNQDNVTGYLVSYPGEMSAGAPALDLGAAAFLKVIQLVR